MSAYSARRLALLAPALLLLAGCAGEGQVSGKVKYKGQPVPAGTITFFDRKNHAISGAIGADGGYSVEKVVSGPVKVTVVTPMPIYMPGDKPPPGPKPPTLPAKYYDREKSGLDFEVKEGPQTKDFDLQ
jgi:hypothetical protein